MTLVDRVGEAVKAATTKPEDAGTIALALEYARLLDAPEPASKYREALEWLHSLDPETEKGERHAALLRSALAEHSVTSDLGPKLLAALESLGMSPRARAALKGGKPDDKPGKSPLDELRAARARKNGATSVDSSTA